MAADQPIMAGVAGRYAAALFDLAKEQNQLDKVETDLNEVQAMLDASPDLLRLVKSPVFSTDDQKRGLSAVLDKAGISGIAGNFIRVVASNRRLFALDDMIKAYKAQLSAHRGEVAAEVTTAHALSESQLADLGQALKASVGKDVKIDARVDPGILGGLIVKVGSRMVDSSLRTKLNNLRTAMKEVR